jgi:hydroxymethylbilane synthase
MTSTIRIGTRASVLATTQSELVAAMLRDRLGYETELVEIATEGDLSQSAETPIEQAGGTGIFVSALRDALLNGEVDVAVHSLKDLPTAAADGIALAAVPPREDPRDVVVARDGLTLGELPAGSRVGTGSPRRVAQLLALGLGLDVVGVRGNVDTRIAKVQSGEYDAVLLARAGLARIGRLEEVTEVLDPLQMLPAPGRTGHARRPGQQGCGRGRAGRAGHSRGRVLRTDRGPGRRGRGRGRRRAVGARGRAVH